MVNLDKIRKRAQAATEKAAESLQKSIEENIKLGLDFSKKVCYNNFRCGGVAQLVRAFGSHPRGRGFEPLRLHHKKSRITLSFVRCLRFSFCLVYARQYPYGVIYKICKSKCKPNIN